MILSPTNGQRFVISDIHGCPKTFQALVESINLSKADQLFLLGDYIDRGNDSGGVLDFIFELQELGYQIFPLRGNHEQMFLDSYSDYSHRLFKMYLKMSKCYNMTDAEGKPKAEYLSFMQNLPYYYELEDCFLVHGGFNFKAENPLTDTKSMIWIRNFEVPMGFKRVIHGHTPTSIFQIREAITNKSFDIPLDNGCVYAQEKKNKVLDLSSLGRLCCLNLNTWELIEQPWMEE
jgi:serine/threonine protein phosphatase 1